MYEQVEKPKDKKSKAVANSITQKTSNVKQSFRFIDNRPDSIVQKNNSTKIPVQRILDTSGVSTPILRTDIDNMVRSQSELSEMANDPKFTLKVFDTLTGSGQGETTLPDDDTARVNLNIIKVIDSAERLRVAHHEITIHALRRFRDWLGGAPKVAKPHYDHVALLDTRIVGNPMHHSHLKGREELAKMLLAKSDYEGFRRSLSSWRKEINEHVPKGLVGKGAPGHHVRSMWQEAASKSESERSSDQQEIVDAIQTETPGYQEKELADKAKAKAVAIFKRVASDRLAELEVMVHQYEQSGDDVSRMQMKGEYDQLSQVLTHKDFN